MRRLCHVSTVILGLLMALAGSAEAQITFIRNYGGTSYDRGQSVRQTSGGGYAVTGFSNSIQGYFWDLVLRKTAADGTVGIEEPKPQSPPGEGSRLVFTSVAVAGISIRYHVPAPGPVTLRLYDHTGVLVAELVNGRREPGSYQAEFRTGNLPAGVYFCQLQAGGSAETAKLAVAR